MTRRHSALAAVAGAAVAVVLVAGGVAVALHRNPPAMHAMAAPPAVEPRAATLSALVTFDAFRNAQGDQLEAINVRLRTDIPTSVRVKVNLEPPPPGVHFGNADQACVSGDGCLVSGGQGLADWWCSNVCPAGAYKVTLDVCSYAEGKTGMEAVGIRCNSQEAAYLAWVGKWGANLSGNPLAVVDPDHTAILNLRRVLTVQR